MSHQDTGDGLVGLTTFEASAESGATIRQLDHWARLGYLPAEPRKADKQGYPRRWPAEAVEKAQILAAVSRLRGGLLAAVAARLADAEIVTLPIEIRRTDGTHVLAVTISEKRRRGRKRAG